MKNTLLILTLVLFSLLSCQKDPQEKLCEDIICLHGGDCVNGECDCPPQYTGPSCAQEVDPIKMKVANFTLTDFPPTAAGGAGWDTFDGADVFLQILKAGVVLHETGYVENLTGDFEFSVNFEFSDPTATYQISVYDYDFGLTSDDFMGGISFTPYKPNAGFPSSYSPTCASCVVAIQLEGIQYFH